MEDKQILEDLEINNEELTKLDKVELELQEVEVLIDQLDMKLSVEVSDDLLEEYNNLKSKYKELLKTRKQIIKDSKSNLDKLPLWIIIFAVIQLIIFFPVGSYYLWMAFANFIIDAFSNALDTVASEGSTVLFNIMVILTIYSLPLINFFVTWTIYVNYNRQEYTKKFLKWIWIIQSILTVGLAIYLYFTVLHGNLQW